MPPAAMNPDAAKLNTTPVARRTQDALEPHVPHTGIAIHQTHEEDYIDQSEQVNVRDAEQREDIGASVLLGLTLGRFLYSCGPEYPTRRKPCRGPSGLDIACYRKCARRGVTLT